MRIDRAACKSFWRSYLAQLPAGHPHHAVRPDAFGFGAELGVADELAALVLAGCKRATTSLPVQYTALGEPLPQPGDLSIILQGDGVPVAIIERTRIETKPFEEVDAAYAAIEGEGDGSLAQWRAGHMAYFGAVCERRGEQFDPRMPVLCQEFRVVWPPT